VLAQDPQLSMVMINRITAIGYDSKPIIFVELVRFFGCTPLKGEIINRVDSGGMPKV
jgi:hypothetical protein